MEWVTYFMIVLIAFASCFGWPVLINFEDSDEPTNTIGSGSGGSVPSNPDPPDLGREKDEDGPGGAIGGCI